MGRVNHNSMNYKRLAQPNKTYKDLKQKQKAKISDWMFNEVCSFYTQNDRIPTPSELEPLAGRVYTKVQGAAIWVPYDSFLDAFEKKLPRFSERISTSGIPVPKPPKVKKTEKEKQAVKRATRRKRKLAAEKSFPVADQDDRFYYITGYTPAVRHMVLPGKRWA